MSTLLEHVARVEARRLLDVDLDLEPQCESVRHGIDDVYDVCHGPAVFWFRAPCGHAGLRCAERIRVIRTQMTYCPICGTFALPGESTIIEL